MAKKKTTKTSKTTKKKTVQKTLELPNKVIGKQIENVRLLPLNVVTPDPNQPRKIDAEAPDLQGLAKSIKEHGVMNPIHVIYLEKENKYQIVNGERRYTSAGIAKLKEIPAIILTEKELKGESDKAIKQLVDNLQREDLKPFEEAEGYQRLMDNYGLAQKDLVKQLGKAKNTISETISLNKISQEVRENVLHAERDSGIRVPKRFLVNLSRLEDVDKQKQHLELFINKATRKAPERKKSTSTKHLMSVAMRYDGTNSKVLVWLPGEISDKKEKKDNLVTALEEALAAAKKNK